MVPMRKKAPRQASLDEVRITREDGIAVIEHADPNVSVSRVSIGPLLKTMSDAAALDLFNRMIEAQEKIAAGYDRVAIEIPPGRPQISFSESSSQWVPRGRILRCHIEDDEGGETAVYIDDRKLDLGEFGRLLNFYARMGHADRVRPRGRGDGCGATNKMRLRVASFKNVPEFSDRCLTKMFLSRS